MTNDYLNHPSDGEEKERSETQRPAESSGAERPLEYRTENLRPETAEPVATGSGYRLIIAVLIPVLIAGGLIILVIALTWPEIEKPSAYFPFEIQTIELEAELLAEPPSQLASGITFIQKPGENLMLKPNQAALILGREIRNLPADSQLAFGFYRRQTDSFPVLMITSQQTTELLNVLRAQESDLPDILSYLKSNGDRNEFQTEYIENSYARVGPGLTYGLIEQSHLVLTGSPEQLRTIILHTREYAK